MFASAPAGERQKGRSTRMISKGSACTGLIHQTATDAHYSCNAVASGEAVMVALTVNGSSYGGAWLFGLFAIGLSCRSFGFVLMLLAYQRIFFGPQAKAFKLYTTDVTGEPLRWL